MEVAEEFEAGWLHRPERPNGNALVITHGAGSNANAPLLQKVGGAFAAAGVLVYRYNLPFRVARQQGPPSPANAAKDQAGVLAAIEIIRRLAGGKLIAGGVSYGGRQTTMLAADHPSAVDGLLLLSYPLHAPGKPEGPRMAHFPSLTMPAVFVHGSRDPFGSEQEMRQALTKIPAPSTLYMVNGAGHDLGKDHSRLASVIVEQTARLFS